MNEINRVASTELHSTPRDAGHDYFVRREAQERALAARATDPIARRLHAELAGRYAALIGTVA